MMTELAGADQIRDHLTFLYGPDTAAWAAERLLARLEQFAADHPQLRQAAGERLTQDDTILITYGDQVREEGAPPLRTLAEVLGSSFRGVVSGVHILPFFPYTSDDGFSVSDFTTVDPALGAWEDLGPLREQYRLMYDAVVNHCSASHAWFGAFLAGEPGAERRFIAMDPETDLRGITRPRTTPVLTPFETPAGIRHIWTTFSADQIDLNYGDPGLLLEMTDVLLLYVAQGAQLIRLDAIGYLWKEVGTRCIHLPQTHRVVQLWRSVLDAVAPGVLLVTETNVPHADNISYFGDGANEAQMVYQFPLAPLTLNAFHRGSARHLTAWASQLAPPSRGTTFFNFLASHDGIGVVPASGILSPEEVTELVAKAQTHGGHVSSKNNPDGTQSPYELNITLFDALSDPRDEAEGVQRKIDRFVCANAIMLALQGVPGIYVHSLIGSPNYYQGVKETGRFRSINREKWDRAELERRLVDSSDRSGVVLARMADLIAKRRREAAFHPAAPQRVVDAGDGVFAFLRTAEGGSERILCAHNVSAVPQRLRHGDVPELAGVPARDLVSGSDVPAGGELELAPYQVVWLKG
jgi:glucosylglycerate phosphorylase